MLDEKLQKAVYKSSQAQQELNSPLPDANGLGDEEKDFLRKLMELIDAGTIDLYKPATLINQEVYGKLTEEKQGKVDLEAMNLLSAIRDIKDLTENKLDDSFQMKNLIERVKNTKERLEEEGGDLFII